jgi:hypothetical protein
VSGCGRASTRYSLKRSVCAILSINSEYYTL